MLSFASAMQIGGQTSGCANPRGRSGEAPSSRFVFLQQDAYIKGPVISVPEKQAGLEEVGGSPSPALQPGG
ncbi:hypothetical protein D3C78_1781670 [compost metagenome]